MIFMYFQKEDIRGIPAAKFQVFSTFGSNFNLAGGSFDPPPPHKSNVHKIKKPIIYRVKSKAGKNLCGVSFFI